MFRTNLRFVLWGALGLWAAAASAADPWQNAQIMPKSDQLMLRVGGEVAGDVHQIEWPATVERIEGQWLWIADHGGYHVPAISGWVSKDEMLKLGEAHDWYMDMLQNYDAPWLHWLIGICLENRRESGPAEEEYLKCLSLKAGPHDAEAVRRAVEGQPNLLDAAVRLLRSWTLASNSAEEAATAASVLKDSRRPPRTRAFAGLTCTSKGRSIFARRSATTSPKSKGSSKKSRRGSQGPTWRRTAGRTRTAISSCRPMKRINSPPPRIPPTRRPALIVGKAIWAPPSFISVARRRSAMRRGR